MDLDMATLRNVTLTPNLTTLLQFISNTVVELTHVKIKNWISRDH